MEQVGRTCFTRRQHVETDRQRSVGAPVHMLVVPIGTARCVVSDVSRTASACPNSASHPAFFGKRIRLLSTQSVGAKRLYAKCRMHATLDALGRDAQIQLRCWVWGDLLTPERMPPSDSVVDDATTVCRQKVRWQDSAQRGSS